MPEPAMVFRGTRVTFQRPRLSRSGTAECGVPQCLAEPLEVELFDELRQGQLPRFLLVVIDLAQLRRVHPQFASHVDLGVRQMVTLSRLDPRLHRLILLLRLLGHAIIFPLDNLANLRV
jgi:hypothetical protein